MNVIIPMAGMGKRMRPHTLTTPKPLLPVAGSSIVERLVESIHKQLKGNIDEISFVIGHFGPDVETLLKNIAKRFNAKASIYYQEEALGTAHAIYCAKKALSGEVVVAFADTLFESQFKINPKADATIWVKKIEDPSSFGVVEVGKNNVITRFVEKPKTFISDLAIIGIYHFKDGDALRKDIEYLIDNNIMKSNEYQLTDVLENMKNNNKTLIAGEVTQWLDFGNKAVFIESMSAVLSSYPQKRKENQTENSIIIEPCFIGQNVIIKNSKIGPYVSVEENTMLEDCVISHSIIMKNSKLIGSNIKQSMIGSYVNIKDDKRMKELNIGDYNTLQYVHD